MTCPLQNEIQILTERAVEAAAPLGVGQAAAVVLDRSSGEILAWVGSTDFRNPAGGQNDGVVARRQPGSTMKPFTYATAFDRGLWPGPDH